MYHTLTMVIMLVHFRPAFLQGREKQFVCSTIWSCPAVLLQPNALGSKLTQKDSLDREVQFITWRVPGRVSSLAKDPYRLGEDLLYKVYVPKPTSPNSLKSTLDNVSKRYNRVRAINLHSKAIWT